MQYIAVWPLKPAKIYHSLREVRAAVRAIPARGMAGDCGLREACTVTSQTGRTIKIDKGYRAQPPAAGRRDK